MMNGKKLFLCFGFALALSLAAAEYRIDLAPFANRGFIDEVAGDGKGGWTDQGPDVDLRDLRQNKIVYDSVTFQLAEEQKTPGRTVMVISGPERGGRTEKITVKLPKNQARGLYLLHAAAWPPTGGPIGRIVARYADGTTAEIIVSTREHCKDWRGISSNLPNGRVAWQGPGFENPVLFASAFQLPKASPAELDFILADKSAIWLIPAVTLNDEFRPFTPLKPFRAEAGKEWLPVPFLWGTVPGSILDFSNLNDGPAGKYGFVTAGKDGEFHFEKAPQKKIRFFGTNLVFACNYPTHAEADRIADELSRAGYNLARLHLNDELLIRKNAKTSLDVDPAQLDKLEYFFAALKKRGLYLSFDLYGCRYFRSGDAPSLAQEHRAMAMKALAPIDPAAKENLKNFCRLWLNHKNPYTGLAWKDDPAVAYFSIINEDNLETTWKNYTKTGRARYEAAFRRHVGGLTGEAYKEAFRREFYAFLASIQDAFLADMTKFLRDELKMKQPFTSLNMDPAPEATLRRKQFEFNDQHFYFDHPTYSFNYKLPWSFSQTSDVTRLAHAPIYISVARRFDRPFVMTEYNSCYPNRYRAEFGPVMAAYASLQNWSSLVHYRWATDDGRKEMFEPYRLSCFSGNCDPLTTAGNRLIALLYRERLIKAAETKFVIRIPDTYEAARKFAYTRDQRLLGLFAQTGSAGISEKIDLPESKEGMKLLDEFRQTGIAKSTTGEITLDSNRRYFVIDAPRAAVIVLDGGAGSSGILKIDAANTFQTIALISRDGKPLKESKRLLLFQLGNMLNSGDTFSDPSCTQLVKFGAPPLLLRRLTARITLTSDRRYQIYALSFNGKRQGAITEKRQNGVFSFTADNFRFGGGNTYEIVAEEEK